ncbi:SpoIIE family protein phosphatase [Microbacterium sp. NPDC096154]|uniref:PP2C family protein-serine/threonine phosphatase n=1 Tax=Microbacterium sp. NPDC096154 TaxID=3155549 RepID=UPI00331D3BFF
MSPLAAHEAERLAAAGGDRFDRIIRLAQAFFRVPIAALNLVGQTEQFTVAAVGAPRGPHPLAQSICRHTVLQDGVLEVRDLREDQRFADNPIVAGPPRVRFYAGVPLRSTSGQRVGSLCILDLVPRQLSPAQRDMLVDLAGVVEREIAVEAEMLRAGDVQAMLLPGEAPRLAGVEIAGRVQQARAAGGDFFDWQVVGAPPTPDRLQFVLADVMGKGLSASLIAAEIRAVLRTHSRYVPLAEAVSRTAASTADDLEVNGRFVTLWAGRLNPGDGTLRYVDAGHGLAAIVSPRGIRRLVQENVPLGVPVAQSFAADTVHLAMDETAIVVSDGIYDVFRDLDAGLEAVQALGGDPELPAAEIVRRIIDFAAAEGSSDDLTAIAVRRKETSG